MSVFIDVKYLNLLSNRLPLYTQKREFLWNFRCPICGDSQKKLTKARGYVHRKNNDLFYKCHNCGVGLSFTNFLKQLDTNLHDQYMHQFFLSTEKVCLFYQRELLTFVI